MLRELVIGALGAIAVMFSTTAFAQGTAIEAKAMLEKATAALKADQAKTLDTINKGRRRIPGPRYLCVLLQPQRRQGRRRWQ